MFFHQKHLLDCLESIHRINYSIDSYNRCIHYNNTYNSHKETIFQYLVINRDSCSQRKKRDKHKKVMKMLKKKRKKNRLLLNKKKRNSRPKLKIESHKQIVIQVQAQAKMRQTPLVQLMLRRSSNWLPIKIKKSNNWKLKLSSLKRSTFIR